MCLMFSAVFIWNTLASKMNSKRHYHRSTFVFMQSARFYCHFLTKHSIAWHIMEISSRIKFTLPSSGSRVVPCERTDRPDFPNSAKAPQEENTDISVLHLRHRVPACRCGLRLKLQTEENRGRTSARFVYPEVVRFCYSTWCQIQQYVYQFPFYTWWQRQILHRLLMH